MKNIFLFFIIFLFFMTSYAQQISVPALTSAKSIEQNMAKKDPECNTACGLNATKKIKKTVRKVKSIPNDDINGFKYPSARMAAEKSTHWANMARTVVSNGDDGRVIVVYGQSVPKIACAYLRVCGVELEAGEIVNKIDAGDPVRWSITPSIVGEGVSRTVHIIIKPKSDESGLFTNIKIATNRRMYDLDIFSVTGERFVRKIAFSYPEKEKLAWEAQRVAMEKESAIVTAELPSFSVEKLNFNYEIDGDYVHRPVRVFDDSYKTYIQMGINFSVQEAPVLVLMDKDGKEQLVNYRLKNGYFIVDKIFSKAALLVGVGSEQQKVVISRGCSRRGFFGSCAQE